MGTGWQGAYSVAAVLVMRWKDNDGAPKVEAPLPVGFCGVISPFILPDMSTVTHSPFLIYKIWMTPESHRHIRVVERSVVAQDSEGGGEDSAH